MPVQPFYGSPTPVGDPLSTKRRYANQGTVGIPVVDMAKFIDFRSNLGPLQMNPTTIAQQTLNGSINRLVALVGKILGVDSTLDLGDFDPANPFLYASLANLMRHYSVSGNVTTVAISGIVQTTGTATATVASTASLVTGQDLYISGVAQSAYNGRHTITVVNGTTFTFAVASGTVSPATGTILYSTSGYNRFLFGPAQSTASAARLTICEDYDQGIPFRYHDCAVKSMTFGATPNQNMKVAVALALAEFTLHGAVTQTSGSGSTVPTFTQFWDGNLAADGVDKDIFHKLVDVVAHTMRSKVSAASSFDTVHAADSYLLGEKSPMYNENVDEVDRIIGTIAEQVRMYLPIGATVTNGDIFRVINRIAAWSPSYGIQRATTSVNAKFLLNGYEISTQGWQVEIQTDGVSNVPNVYGRQSSLTRLTGQVIATIKPTREIADRDLQNALLLGTTLPVILEWANDNEIGVSGVFYRGRIVCPAVKFAGNTFSPAAGGKDRTEALTGEAGVPDVALSYDGSSWSDAVTAELRSDLTASVLTVQ